MSRRTVVRLVAALSLGAAATLAVPALPAVGSHSPPTFAHDVEILGPGTLVSRGAGVSVPVEVTCGEGGEVAFVDVRLTQRRGNRVSTGFGSTQVTCTGSPQTVDVLVTAQNGSFKKGPALAEAHLVACNPTTCQSDTDIEEIAVK
ncbi:MAG: hypothetical protein ABR540_13785 [Acidimicrobiales bacterium]|nr:hypothetical protein [Actinomycetota bacterium]